MNEQIHYNDMQLVKRRFFAMRNGVIADALRKGSSPYHIIFGVNLPQIREIAAGFEPSLDLASRLWADTRTRESALLAPWLLPKDDVDDALALDWLRRASSAEAVDVMCMARLRSQPFAPAVALQLVEGPSDLNRYAAMRLILNNLNDDSITCASALSARFADSDRQMLRALAHQIADELEFIG